MRHALAISPLAARLFQLHALRFERPLPDLESALAHLGYIQIDPINVCGRMHDLILRNRVVGYAEGDLMRHLHAGPPGKLAANAASAPALSDIEIAGSRRPSPEGRHKTSLNGGNVEDSAGFSRGLASPRTPHGDAPDLARAPVSFHRLAFEHHHPETDILAAWPLEAWAHHLAAMRERSRRTSPWSGRLTPRERALAPMILREIADRGPLGSEDFDDERRAHRVAWGAATLVKSTLQKMFFHGCLLIAQRGNNRRRYDLPERVLPPHILARSAPPASDTKRWLVRLKLRQRRLAALKREEQQIAADFIQAVAVANCPDLFCLLDDLPLLEECRAAADSASRAPSPGGGADSPRIGSRLPCGTTGCAGGLIPPSEKVRLIAPLDPLIYDRRVTAALWSFDYAWEAYTPARKRFRGHYALPVLAGAELVGHVEPRVDRERRRLANVSRSIRRGHRVAGALDALAAWLGVNR